MRGSVCSGGNENPSGSDRSFVSRRPFYVGIRVAMALAFVAVPFAATAVAPTVAAGAGVAGSVSLTTVASDFPNPIGIDYYMADEPTCSVGQLHSGVNRTTLTFSIISHFRSLSNVSGLTDEVYLAAIRASLPGWVHRRRRVLRNRPAGCDRQIERRRRDAHESLGDAPR